MAGSIAMDLTADTEITLIEFGTDATYTDAAGVLKKIRVIFSPEAYTEGQVVNVAAVTAATQAVAKSVDVPSADNRCKLKVDDVLYKVRQAKPYGDGWTILMLSRD